MEGLRQLALFLFAVLIVANTAWRHFSEHPPATHSPAANTIHLSGGKLAPGLYQLQDTTTYAELYHRAGLSLPDSTEFDSEQSVPTHATIVLQEGRRPEVGGPHPTLAPLVFLPIPINRANAAEIATITGIGPGLAERIVDYRCKHGEFKSKNELLKVKGIGPKTLEKINSLISLS